MEDQLTTFFSAQGSVWIIWNIVLKKKKTMGFKKNSV